MRFKKIPVYLLAFVLFSNLGCKCGNALCDLITNIAFQGAVSVLAGNPIVIPNLIENVKETVEECKGELLETATAALSESRLQIDFDASNNYGTNVLNNNFSVPEIPGGMSAEESYEFLFTEPGDYRLITFADDKKNNEERDEDNNKSADEFAEAGKTANPGSVRAPLIIHVLPNPNFTRQKGQAPVEILSRTVRLIE